MQTKKSLFLKNEPSLALRTALGLFLCLSHPTCRTPGRPSPCSDTGSTVTFHLQPNRRVTCHCMRIWDPGLCRYSIRLFPISNFYVFGDANNSSGALSGFLYLPCNSGGSSTHIPNFTFIWEQLRFRISSTCPFLSLHPWDLDHP